MSEKTALPARSEVPREQTWEFESIFSTPSDWNTACQHLGDLLPVATAYQCRLKEDPQVLLEFL